MRILMSSVMAVASVTAFAADTAIERKLQDAMRAEIRTEAELARDKNRKPVETLSFCGLRDDMRVLEMLPGSGWYTKLLAPALRENGELHVAIGVDNVRENLVTRNGFEHVNVIDIGVELKRTGPLRTINVEPFDFGITDVNLVLTFRNLHNFTPEGRAAVNAAVFTGLRSGGLYCVVDHTRRHMQALTGENRRRSDPVMIIKELQAAGFEFVDFSDLHYRPDDELRYEVGRKTVTGNTDRFTLLFRRP